MSKESVGPTIISTIVIVDSEGNERPFVPGDLDDSPSGGSEPVAQAAAPRSRPFKWPGR